MLRSVAAGAFADVALEREFRRHGKQLSAADRALTMELTYGSIRQRRLLDHWLDYCGAVPAQQQPPLLRWLLHLGLYQLLFAHRIPEAVAVSSTVELAKAHGLGSLAAVVNGILRAVVRCRQRQEEPPLPRQPTARFAARHSLPDWLAALLLQWLPEEEAVTFATLINQPPHLDLRINRLRATVAEVQAAWGAVDQPLLPIAMAPQGLQLPQGVGAMAQQPGYDTGQWSVQDRAAQLVAPLLQPQPGHVVVDMCAAPGGKTTHIAELMGDQGRIIAVDHSAGRLGRLQRNARRLGLRSIQTRCADARALPHLHGCADRVLLDAPCSGLGTLARHACARWRLSPEAIAKLQVLQRQLLNEALQLVRPGGRLVYATCTVHPSENQTQINVLLSQHPQWRQCPLPEELQQLCGHGTQLQLWPQRHGCDGFFAVVLEPVIAIRK
ncbi:16S rRNA (cytosine(967)-C(5))-methyltransferase (EC 2.1.1.176) [Candidatus Synechococcus spongiarum]|uniref:16S rRNA (cytosine(967)-C(5))-methyltransferase n=1 Tax=Candidatus Synechococcus spongiarum TaxID=431041 RepID=A0A164YWB3_9SYNE|nr:16S rRNA (cytosine(967)-C(5))-methyltransferase (EC 2.1.1.176) [Candidatus Synechococcus spongiarum]